MQTNVDSLVDKFIQSIGSDRQTEIISTFQQHFCFTLHIYVLFQTLSPIVGLLMNSQVYFVLNPAASSRLAASTGHSKRSRVDFILAIVCGVPVLCMWWVYMWCVEGAARQCGQIDLVFVGFCVYWFNVRCQVRWQGEQMYFLTEIHISSLLT